MIEYSTFVLCDSDKMDLSPLDDPPSAELIHVGDQAVVFSSAGNDFYPDVRLEIWDGEPPPPAADWDQVQDGTFHAPSGQLSLIGTTGSEYLDLPVPAHQLHIRAACRGRAEAASRADQFFHGVEIWLIQLWPA